MLSAIAASQLAIAPTPHAYFGIGAVGRLPGVLRDAGCDAVLVVTDTALATTPVIASVTGAIEAAGMPASVFSGVHPNPTTGDLAAGAEALRPGGVLVYSTCTISTIENEHVIANFLESHADFSLDDLAPELPAFADDGSSEHGLPGSALRDYQRKLIFVPAGHEFVDWQETRSVPRLAFFYFDPSVLPLEDHTLVAPRLFFEDAELWRTALKLKSAIEGPRAAIAAKIRANRFPGRGDRSPHVRLHVQSAVSRPLHRARTPLSSRRPRDGALFSAQNFPRADSPPASRSLC